MGRPERHLPAGRATVGELVVLERQLEDAGNDHPLVSRAPRGKREGETAWRLVRLTFGESDPALGAWGHTSKKRENIPGNHHSRDCFWSLPGYYVPHHDEQPSPP